MSAFEVSCFVTFFALFGLRGGFEILTSICGLLSLEKHFHQLSPQSIEFLGKEMINYRFPLDLSGNAELNRFYHDQNILLFLRFSWWGAIVLIIGWFIDRYISPLLPQNLQDLGQKLQTGHLPHIQISHLVKVLSGIIAAMLCFEASFPLFLSSQLSVRDSLFLRITNMNSQFNARGEVCASQRPFILDDTAPKLTHLWKIVKNDGKRYDLWNDPNPPLGWAKIPDGMIPVSDDIVRKREQHVQLELSQLFVTLLHLTEDYSKLRKELYDLNILMKGLQQSMFDQDEKFTSHLQILSVNISELFDKYHEKIASLELQTVEQNHLLKLNENEINHLRERLETDMKKTISLSSNDNICLLSKSNSCPKGFMVGSNFGVIYELASGTRPNHFVGGAKYNEWWEWFHGTLCCN